MAIEVIDDVFNKYTDRKLLITMTLVSKDEEEINHVLQKYGECHNAIALEKAHMLYKCIMFNPHPNAKYAVARHVGIFPSSPLDAPEKWLDLVIHRSLLVSALFSGGHSDCIERIVDVLNSEVPDIHVFRACWNAILASIARCTVFSAKLLNMYRVMLDCITEDTWKRINGPDMELNLAVALMSIAVDRRFEQIVAMIYNHPGCRKAQGVGNEILSLNEHIYSLFYDFMLNGDMDMAMMVHDIDEHDGFRPCLMLGDNAPCPFCNI